MDRDVARGDDELRWTEGGSQLADCFTKFTQADYLLRVLVSGEAVIET